MLKGMHVTSLPEQRAELLAGTLHTFLCPKCSAAIRVEIATVYTDFDRSDYVAVEPIGTMLSMELRRFHQGVFDRAFTLGPEVAQELGCSVRHRLVAGLPALREKVMAWDAGLDDRVLEATKADQQAQRGLRGEEWRLARVLTGGHLVFARLAPTSPTEEGCCVVPCRAHLGFHTVPRAIYERRLRDRADIADAYPALMGSWVVDIADEI